MSIRDPIKKVFIEEDADQFEQTNRILEQLHNIPKKTIPMEIGKKQESTGMDKETLRLMPFKGAFLKPCPGTKEYICCGYQILHIGTNCPFDCSYCILQSYFNQPSLRVFVNLEDELPKIAQFLDSHPNKVFRLGTGEFTDSLALDHITDWSNILGRFIQDRKNAVLELKTKTNQINNLLSSPYRNRIIVSWSLNSKMVASREEHNVPSIKKRIEAAKKCQEEGFTLGFHFDPLIHYPNWKEDYIRTIELLDQYIDPKGIIWISLGCFRYVLTLKNTIRKRHPKSNILNHEFIAGLDGKRRYLKPLRIEMYAFMNEIIQKWKKNMGLYLCMESEEVWEKSLKWSPQNTEGLTNYLDKRVTLFFH